MKKNLLLSYANNKGADQPAHPRSLARTFVVRYLDSILSILTNAKISRLQLVSVVAQAGLNLTWSQTPKTGFLVTRLIWLTHGFINDIPSAFRLLECHSD